MLAAGPAGDGGVSQADETAGEIFDAMYETPTAPLLAQRTEAENS